MKLLLRCLAIISIVVLFVACQEGTATPGDQATSAPAATSTPSSSATLDAVADIVDNIDASRSESLDTVEGLVRLGLRPDPGTE